MPLKPPFSSLKAWLIDMDGVLYHGARPLPAASDFIHALQETHTPFLFLTNNATRTPAAYVQRLGEMGIRVHEDAIFTSALATVYYVNKNFPPPRQVLVVGGDGIRVDLEEAGYRLTGQADEAELVVSAMDTEANYALCAEATLAIRAGAPWVQTNPDRTFPSERGIVPGAGAIQAFLEAATDQTPIVIGKPQPGIFRQALTILGARPEETVMLGDRLETDILGGHRAGLKTICVLTGIASREQAEAYDPRPDWIIEDLRALLA
ncbi:MAG TPA: HAD family hydrolase [Anaerolineae bacterium]|nr:HAD family hydrolase [Caldilineae bacterium]HID32966.1 HAD family hydrolase [Anaerolineae bacterium]HIQ11959.1 HAD family hydrolase [Caldilineales bacterium]